MSVKKRNRGFTIIEMLTVFTILVIIGYSLSVMMKQIMNSYTVVTEKQTTLRAVRTIMQRMTHDIENAFLVRDSASKYEFQGTPNTINFNAMRNSGNGPEVVEIGYTFDAGTNQLKRRLQTANVPDNDVTSGGTTDILADDISSVAFDFGYRTLGGTLAKASASHNKWDSTTNLFATNCDRTEAFKNPDGLPDIVYVTITFLSSSESFDFGVYTMHDA